MTIDRFVVHIAKLAVYDKTIMKKNLRTAFSSRQYMISRDYELYYYEDTDFHNVKDHTHDYYEFYIFLQGDVTLTVRRQDFRLLPGDIILVPPHTKHHLTINDASVPYRRFIFWIGKAYAEELISRSGDYGYLLSRASSEHIYVYHPPLFSFQSIQAKIISLLEEQNSSRFGKETKIALSCADLVLSLNRSVYEMEHTDIEKEETDLYRRILDYIEENITEELSLDHLGARFYVSKFYVSHLIKEHTGLSVHQYILRKRLQLCRNMIIAGSEITSAYTACGFHDYSSFFRAFKKEYGISPKEYALTYSLNPVSSVRQPQQ